jgi:hypothetical protein
VVQDIINMLVGGGLAIEALASQPVIGPTSEHTNRKLKAALASRADCRDHDSPSVAGQRGRRREHSFIAGHQASKQRSVDCDRRRQVHGRSPEDLQAAIRRVESSRWYVTAASSQPSPLTPSLSRSSDKPFWEGGLG